MATLVLLGLLIVAAATIALLLGRAPRPLAQATEPVPAGFATFWKAFANGPEEPWVIFSNGAFVGRPETGMRYFDPARDSRMKSSNTIPASGKCWRSMHSTTPSGCCTGRFALSAEACFPSTTSRITT